MIKATELLLVIVIGLGATRDIVCQFACAEPGAAHAASSCHESGDMGGSRFEAVAYHCAIDISPATIVSKAGLLDDRGFAAGVRLQATLQQVTLPTPLYDHTLPFVIRSTAGCTSVLRI